MMEMLVIQWINKQSWMAQVPQQLPLLDRLAEQGLLGLLLALSIILNAILLKMLLVEKDKAIANAEKVRDNIVAPISTINSNIAILAQAAQNSSKD